MGAIALIGGAMQAVGEYQAGQKNAANMRYNQKIAKQQAQEARERGQREKVKFMKGINKLVGSQRAAFAAQGIEVDAGTALDYQTDTRTQAEDDARTIINNAALEAWGYEVQAVNYGQKAEVAAAEGISSGFNTILTSGLKYAGYT